MAINHLVSSAVEGLSPDAVSVLDMNGNLLDVPSRPQTLDGPEPSEAILDYRRKLEADLLSKVNSTLEPLLGANRFRAGVSVECDFSGGEQSEEVFDPSRSVMVSSQRTEDNYRSHRRHGRTGHGIQPAASHIAPGQREQGSLPRHGKRHLPDHQDGEKNAASGRRDSQDVAGRHGGPGTALGADGKRLQAGAGPAAAGEAESHPGPGGGRHWLLPSAAIN